VVSKTLHVITFTGFNVFNVFFKIKKNVTFYVFCFVAMVGFDLITACDRQTGKDGQLSATKIDDLNEYSMLLQHLNELEIKYELNTSRYLPRLYLPM